MKKSWFKSKKLWLGLIIFITVFIFSNSIEPASESSEKSGVIVNFIVKLLNITTETGRSKLVFVVRKCAHMAEFAVLSACYGMYFYASDKKFKSFFKYVLLFGVATACIDEFLQLFPPGRSCELRDILIDSTGVLIGLAAVRIFIFMDSWYEAKRKKSE